MRYQIVISLCHSIIKEMKVVILAGGRGSRISEETHNKPKPIVAIGNKPILWHIMNHYSRYGFRNLSYA